MLCFIALKHTNPHKIHDSYSASLLRNTQTLIKYVIHALFLQSEAHKSSWNMWSTLRFTALKHTNPLPELSLTNLSLTKLNLKQLCLTKLSLTKLSLTQLNPTKLTLIKLSLTKLSPIKLSLIKIYLIQIILIKLRPAKLDLVRPVLILRFII